MFRPVRYEAELDGAIEAARQISPNFTERRFGRIAVSLVELGEVQRQVALGRMASNEVAETLFSELPRDLLRLVRVTPAGVSITHRQSSHRRNISLLFDSRSTERLDRERREILDILEDEAGERLTWNPHQSQLTLMEFPVAATTREVIDVAKTVAQALPEEIYLERAKIHLP